MHWKLVRPLLAAVAVVGLLGLAPGAADAETRHQKGHERLRSAVSNGDVTPRQAAKKHHRIHKTKAKKHRKAHRKHRRRHQGQGD